MELKDRIRELRKRLALSQQRLADLAGIDRTEVSKLETGKNAASTDEMRKALAKAFDIAREDMDRFIDGEMSVNDALARVGVVLAKSSSTATPFELAVFWAKDDGVDDEAVEQARAYMAAHAETATWDKIACLKKIYEFNEPLRQAKEAARIARLERLREKDPPTVPTKAKRAG